MRTDSPTGQVVDGSGLPIRTLVWEAEGAAPDGRPTTLLLLHGYLDCGGTFSPLVEHLPPWLRVLAPDLRGHGESGRVPHGCWYHYVDYVRDVRAVIDALHPGGRLILLGHSMGGGVSTLFAGSWPEEVERLVLVEGLGPPREENDMGPGRLARWVRELDAGPRPAKGFPSAEDAAARLVRQNPVMPPERALAAVQWLAEEVDGAWRWRHDPWHRARTPQLYQPERYAPFLRAITVPVLLVTGGKSWYRWGDLEERRANLIDRRRLHLDEVGHMVHYEVPDVLAQAVQDFVLGLEPTGSVRPAVEADG